MPRQTVAAPMDAMAKTIEEGDPQRMKALLEAFREKGGTRLPQWIGDRRLIHEAARRGELEMVRLLAGVEEHELQTEMTAVGQLVQAPAPATVTSTPKKERRL